MDIGVVSLFPQMIATLSDFGVVGRAIGSQRVNLRCVNPREHTEDVHRTVDDRPYGGGPGMVLKVAPFRKAIEQVKKGMPADSPVIFLGPQGRRFDQNVAVELGQLPGMVLVAGRYEGFDERLVQSLGDDEISLGDFVLSGGELAALAVVDAVVRLLPGVLGAAESAEQDSFGNGLLDYPHYTRPESEGGMDVPRVLLDGNHEEIRRWRLKQSLGSTWIKRPDLLEGRDMLPEEQQLLQEFINESGVNSPVVDK